jgi:menaquinone-9 beta-reductase
VLVVGAGPGGSSTAYHLARRGLDVLLVDRAVFPREKVCGDGLTPRGVRALQRMDVDPLEPGFVRVDGLRTYGVEGFFDEYPWPALRDFPSFGVVRSRYDFDNLLVERAVKAGATFLQGTEAAAPVMEGGWVTGATLRQVAGNGTAPEATAREATAREGATAKGPTRKVRARYVVAADGASSRFAQRAGVVRDHSRPVAIAARRYYRIPRPQLTVLEAFLDLWDRDGIMAGYGWIFPLGDGLVNVGAGLLNTFKRFKEVSARKVMDVFLAQLPPEWEVTEENAAGPLLSGPIPMGINRTPLAVPGMLLVGDAAGVTNPFNGEGIAYAMETGELAAELVGEAVATDRPGLAQMYPVLVEERYGKYFAAGNVWVRAIGNPRFMRFCVEHGFKRRKLMTFALRVMANLTDGKKGDAQDRLMHALVSMAPSR